MKKALLIEIGTEEIPASFLAPAVNDFKEKFCNFLTENRITFGTVKTYYTPRRLALVLSDVLEKQKAEVLEVQGPPSKYAFDEHGKPTKVAIGFAQTHKTKITQLYTKKTPKGEYVFVKKTADTKTLAQLLKENLGRLIAEIQFPKTMRWQKDNFRFARPIRWLTLVFGNRPIEVSVFGIKSSAHTYGHRNSKKQKIKISDIKSYIKKLKQFDVLVDPEERKKYIQQQLQLLTQKVNGKVVKDEELLAEIINICENPYPVICKFRPEFLNLPAPILTTALKTHTRCFAVQKLFSEELLPYFVAVTNTPTCDKHQVRYWYEQAVESRLDDAKFFFEEDLKIGLEKRLEEEKKVIWIENLGTLFDKSTRLEKLSLVISQNIPNVSTNHLLRAAYLAKADLLTNMVREKEYTSLQGIMGGIYAQRLGEHDLVSKAIAEQYQPRFIGDSLPETIEGSILSMADKLDNIIGAFIANATPSGSYDPLGLRRQAIAFYLICLNKKFDIDLEPIIELGYNYFGLPENLSLITSIKDFLKDRLKAVLLDQNIRYDICNAVLAVCNLKPQDAYERCLALTELSEQKDFESLVIGQKRVSNILKNIKELDLSGLSPTAINELLLIEPAEKILYQKTKEIEPNLRVSVKEHNYKKAFEILLSLRPAIDNLFDNVLVMTEDESLRINRLQLVQKVRALFLEVADLSEIVINKS
ncbi:MAG: glycine--tRNA ligase subunit beta [candidate division WOR-3 bacterium]|nr:glycine--tRNA ligase subunit beta [candidate division WOR-3 bacterium]